MLIESVKDLESYINGKLQHSSISLRTSNANIREIVIRYQTLLNHDFKLIRKDIISFKKNDIISYVEQQEDFKQIATELWRKESELEDFMNNMLRNQVDTDLEMDIKERIQSFETYRNGLENVILSWDQFTLSVHQQEADQIPLRYYIALVEFIESSEQQYYNAVALVDGINLNNYQVDNEIRSLIQNIGVFIIQKWFNVFSVLSRDVDDMTIRNGTDLEVSDIFNRYEELSHKMKRGLREVVSKLESQVVTVSDCAELEELMNEWQSIESPGMNCILLML